MIFLLRQDPFAKPIKNEEIKRVANPPAREPLSYVGINSSFRVM